MSFFQNHHDLSHFPSSAASYKAHRQRPQNPDSIRNINIMQYIIVLLRSIETDGAMHVYVYVAFLCPLHQRKKKYWYGKTAKTSMKVWRERYLSGPKTRKKNTHEPMDWRLFSLRHRVRLHRHILLPSTPLMTMMNTKATKKVMITKKKKLI